MSVNVSDADKQKLENLRLAYVKAQETNSPDLEKAREAYQDLAIQLLGNVLSGKPDITPGPGPEPDEGYQKPGGWGSQESNLPNVWQVVQMKDDPNKWKVVDSKAINIATEFRTQQAAQAFVEKARSGGSSGGGTTPPSPPPVVGTDKDQFGIIKIYKDKPGGAFDTNFKGREMERHYASGKASENSYEYTAIAASNDQNSDVECTFYEKINGFKKEPDTISDKATGPEHQDGAKSWVIAQFRTDGSTADTYETESPHPNYQKMNPKPLTSIGGSIVGKWFGHKHITYVKDGVRYVESWIHFPVDNIDNVAAEQSEWRQYVKNMKVGSGFTQARGRLTTSRLDGINKGSPPDFKYCSVREISPP